VTHQRGEHRFGYTPDQGETCDVCEHKGTDVQIMVITGEEENFYGLLPVHRFCDRCRCNLVDWGVEMMTNKTYRRMMLGEKCFVGRFQGIIIG
jgi:hypothetical protein